jgi:hypothetical protein
MKLLLKKKSILYFYDFQVTPQRPVPLLLPEHLYIFFEGWHSDLLKLFKKMIITDYT